MPTYEYRCPDGHEFEHFYRKISDSVPELPCPECGKLATRRLSGGAGLVFKGSGFYLTDYGRNAHRKAEPSSSGKKESGEGSAGESKSSESKASESKASESKASESKSSETSGTSEKKAPKAESSGTSSAAPPPKGKSES
ncbi:MAG TPA: zinc ribbon domain-containing protein [Gemmatimonadaceae bacterium]|jgi:putative FmdB family regulatory protein|nr:zinc ribbon domain-containing protein [Gemmatimonadaceae bacterium]